MVTRARIPIRLLVPLVAGCVLLLAGCDAGEDAVAGFAGGTNSKDKQPIPSSVNASAGPAGVVDPTAAQPPGAAGAKPGGQVALAGPAVATKGEKRESDEPIRIASNQYRAQRARDPFASLIGTDERSDLVDLSVVQLVGVVTSGNRPFAIVEDAEGVSYVLRKGDRVKNGRVVRVTQDALVCSQTMLGYTTTVQLKLERGKDVKNG